MGTRTKQKNDTIEDGKVLNGKHTKILLRLPENGNSEDLRHGQFHPHQLSKGREQGNYKSNKEKKERECR